LCRVAAFVYPNRLTVTRSLIGCARMYASSPTLSTAWRTLLARLTTALLDAHRDPALAPILEALLLTRFVPPSFDRLAVFLERQHEAEAAGYPRLA
jgi:hypothetical protein